MALICDNGEGQHALRRDRIDRDAGSAEAMVEQDLDEGAAERVAHQDGRPIKALEGFLEVLDGFRHGDALDRRWVARRASTSTSKPG